MSEQMKQAFGLVQRPWGVFYLKNKITGQQTSLKTSDKNEAQRMLQAHNESEIQPHFNLSLARVYMNGADPKLGTRTWQEVMENIVAKKKDETRRRWEIAIRIPTSIASVICRSARRERNTSTRRWRMARCPAMFICGGCKRRLKSAAGSCV